MHPFYTYAHVPVGYTGDATGTIVAQIERFAPGFRDRILRTAVCSTTEMSRKNANYVGGDMLSGANDSLQLLFRPRVTLHPDATGADGVFVCSAATPPPEPAHTACRDTGQHGMPCARSKPQGSTAPLGRCLTLDPSTRDTATRRPSHVMGLAVVVFAVFAARNPRQERSLQPAGQSLVLALIGMVEAPTTTKLVRSSSAPRRPGGPAPSPGAGFRGERAALPRPGGRPNALVYGRR
ncbi:hypothetical protein ACWEVY_31900 [Streptomyces longwoodensis]